jgi:alkaline phosphatase
MKENGGPHMIGMRVLFLTFAVLAVSGGQPAAQTIYPLTRAEILVGAKFDFKVEFSSTTAAKEVKVTVNGRGRPPGMRRPHPQRRRRNPGACYFAAVVGGVN